MRPIVPEDLHRNGHARRRQSVAAVTRALSAHALSVARKGAVPVEHIRARWPDDRLAAFVAKGTSSPAMTTQAGWAAELAHSVVADFVAALASASAGADLFVRGLQLGLIETDRYACRRSSSSLGTPASSLPARGFLSTKPRSIRLRSWSRGSSQRSWCSRESWPKASNAEKLIADLLVRSSRPPA